MQVLRRIWQKIQKIARRNKYIGPQGSCRVKFIEKNATEKRRLKHVRQNKSCARVQGLKLFTVNFIIMKSAERSAMLLYCTSMSSFYADFSCPAYVG